MRTDEQPLAEDSATPLPRQAVRWTLVAGSRAASTAEQHLVFLSLSLQLMMQLQRLLQSPGSFRAGEEGLQVCVEWQPLCRPFPSPAARDRLSWRGCRA